MTGNMPNLENMPFKNLHAIGLSKMTDIEKFVEVNSNRFQFLLEMLNKFHEFRGLNFYFITEQNRLFFL